MSVTKMLKGHELFRSLSVEEVDRISSFSSLKEFQKDDSVFEGGAVGAHFFVLIEGTVHLRLPTESHEAGLVVGRIEKGDMFGLAPLLDAGEYTTTAQCSQACRVLAIEAKPLRALLKKNSLVGLHVMGAVARAYFSRYVEILKRLQRVMDEIAAI